MSDHRISPIARAEGFILRLHRGDFQGPMQWHAAIEALRQEFEQAEEFAAAGVPLGHALPSDAAPFNGGPVS